MLQRKRVEWWLPIAVGRQEWGGVGQREQTVSYKMSKFWGYNVWHDD